MGPSPDPVIPNSKKEFAQNGKISDSNHLSNGPIMNISMFYENTNIFITGATGFLGKALVEKLLRSCNGINSIYLLMRSKRGKISEQRKMELFENPVFNRIREECPGAFKKVKVIPGDVGLPDLGMSEEDKNFIIQNTNIVFHSAATVRFDEDLKTAVTINTLGTKRMLQICKTMKNLKSFVHVSTAYSNSDKETVEEAIYKPTFAPDDIINNINTLPQEVINLLEKKILEVHPNTYTFTKGAAEQLVLESFNFIPAAIVRPSIVTAAWKEPYPGWVDNRMGITGLFLESGKGTVKSIICDDRCRADLIPVDLVVNTIITTAWHTIACSSKQTMVSNAPVYCDLDGVLDVKLKKKAFTWTAILERVSYLPGSFRQPAIRNCQVGCGKPMRFNLAWSGPGENSHGYAKRSNKIRVYNCTSGSTNPITWKYFGDLTQKYFREYPTKYVFCYPGFSFCANRTLHNFYVMLFHVLPSVLLDMYFYTTNRKPIMMKFCQKLDKVLESFSFFTTHQWNFKTSTMDSLKEAIKCTGDGERFRVDLGKSNSFDWNLYMKAYTIGARKYILNDDLSSLPEAKAKLNRLYWIQKMLQTLLILIAVIPLIKYILQLKF